MKRRTDKGEAVILRRKGNSYSQIKDKLGVSKSTLSIWLRDMPLSQKRLDQLQRNDKVIEKIRETKQKNRNARLDSVHKKVNQDIGVLTQRDVFIAGICLYWAEGGKTTDYRLGFANTDPEMIIFYIAWLMQIGVQKNKIKVKLHLYNDMNIDNENRFWRKVTGIPARQFNNPYIKESKISDVTRKGFGHGTCNINVDDRDITEYVKATFKVLPKALQCSALYNKVG